jgi:hypothetical protein
MEEELNEGSSIKLPYYLGEFSTNSLSEFLNDLLLSSNGTVLVKSSVDCVRLFLLVKFTPSITFLKIDISHHVDVVDALAIYG